MKKLRSNFALFVLMTALILIVTNGTSYLFTNFFLDPSTPIGRAAYACLGTEVNFAGEEAKGGSITYFLQREGKIIWSSEFRLNAVEEHDTITVLLVHLSANGATQSWYQLPVQLTPKGSLTCRIRAINELQITWKENSSKKE